MLTRASFREAYSPKTPPELDTISEMRLTSQVALITGGGTGIGAAIARRFAAEGASVVLTGRRSEPLAAVGADTGAVALRGDVADPAHAAEAVATAVERFGGLDVIVNNAGTGGSDWRRIIDVNLTGAQRICEAALPQLVERRGSIVNIASVSAFVAHAGGAAYTASKAGLVMLTKTLALDYGPHGVRVNAVCPGWVRTEMGDRSMDEIAEARGITRDDAYRLTARHVPLRREGTPDEIAAACLFLASAEASFVTGSTLVVDGGGMVVDVAMVDWPA
jgi:meso-butanediol dehydrogenase / (S,S)-butanediol dehydrogenase / diacetyl reductase